MNNKRFLKQFINFKTKYSKSLYVIKSIAVLFIIQLIVSCSTRSKQVALSKINSQQKSSAKAVSYKVGNQNVFFNIYENTNNSIVYLNLHDDENTSVQAAKSVRNKIGGKLIEINATNDRNISFSYQGENYQFDPNRIYTSKGVKKTLETQGNYSQKADSIVTGFAHFIVDSLLVNSKIIVTLHNNNEGRYSIDYYKKGGIYEKDASEIYVNPEQDPDDFFYVTDTVYYRFLKEKAYNTLLQNNANVTDDGSLSVYCGKKQIRYINVEAQTDHLQKQKEMLLVLQGIINN